MSTFKPVIAKILTILSIFLLNGCITEPKRITSSDWNVATRQIVHQYGPAIRPRLEEYFIRAGMLYPPRRIALLTFKHERRMELWAQDRISGWCYIKRYKLKAFSGKLGPKLRSGDNQIPEGIYRVTVLNPFSNFHLSMATNYPNAFDRRNARLDGRVSPGSHIFIHGKNSSVGCLTIGDDAIQELFVLAYQVGIQNIEVITAPNDLRKSPPKTTGFGHVRWLPQLYRDLSRTLNRFKR